MSTVLPPGSPARAGEPGVDDGAAPAWVADAGPQPAADVAAAPCDDGAARAEAPRPGRLDRWPAPVRVPLQVLGHTLAKAWQDRILGLSAEAAFWQILSVPPLLIGLLGSLGYLSSLIGSDAVKEIEGELLTAAAQVLTSDPGRHPRLRAPRRGQPRLPALALGGFVGHGDLHEHHRDRL
jgi:membrane protein